MPVPTTKGDLVRMLHEAGHEASSGEPTCRERVRSNCHEWVEATRVAAPLLRKFAEDDADA